MWGLAIWNRPHVETLDPDEQAFRPFVGGGLAPGLTVRTLSQDASDGATSALVRVPAGWHQTEPLVWAVDVEFYLLEGDLTIGETRFGPHWYSYRPAGVVNAPARSEQGALLIVFTSGWLTPGGARPREDAILALDTTMVPWGKPMTDKRDSPLLSKTLRLNPVTGERVFLNRLDQPGGDPRIEWHPCVEELYQISGVTSMDSPRDRFVLRPGVYCYRPPGIPHGPFRAEGNVLTLVRVSATLVNFYVSPAEAEAMLRAYGPGLDPRMRP